MTLNELQIKNTKMKKLLLDMWHKLDAAEFNAQFLRRKNTALQNENAKLWELVEAMPYCMYPPKCVKCPLFSNIGGIPECKARTKLRELGMEMDFK